MEQWREIFPHPVKKALLLFYRPFSITAVVRSRVMAIVPLCRLVLVTAGVESGIVAIIE